MTAIQSPADNPEASPPHSLSSPFLDSTAYIRRSARTVVLYPWHQSPDERPDLERIDEGYAADSVESWFPIDDHHWYFTRDDLGRLFQETTGIRGDLYLRKTTELRRWLARALDEGEVRAYWWSEPEISLPAKNESDVALAMAGPGANAWHGMKDEPQPAPKAKPKPEPWPENEPSNFDECRNRLEAAKERIQVHQFQPRYSDAELMAIRDTGTINERFIVWVTHGAKSDANIVGYKRNVTNRTTSWTCPFTQVEDADLDPALICAKNAMTYHPDAEYTMVIMDRTVVVPEASGEITFVPTYANMSGLGVREFSGDYDESALRLAMTDEGSRAYSELHPKYEAFCKGSGKDYYDPLSASLFSASLSPELGKLFSARHLYNAQLGANSDFVGNGLTKQKILPGGTAPIKEYGSVEAITFSKNTPTIGQRKAAGQVAVIAIPKKSIKT